MNTIRSFDWRDFGLLRRVGSQGLYLDTETALTHGPHTLQKTLLAYLTPGTSRPTFVLPATDGDGGDGNAGAFGRIRHRPGAENARVMYVAPAAMITSPAGTALLEGLSVAAGKRGAHNLLAEVDEGSDESEALRALGFSVFARQEIWRSGGEARDLGQAPHLRLQEPVDSFGIKTLYVNIVPRLVQQFEPPPARRSRGYVYVSDSEVLAYLDVARGPQGILVQPFFHPAVRDVAGMLSQFVRQLPDQRNRPLYFLMRSYENWLHRPLEEVGFVRFAEQAVLVKRLAVRNAHVKLAPMPVLEGGAEVASTMMKGDLENEATYH